MMIMIRLLMLYLRMRKLRWMNIRQHSVLVNRNWSIRGEYMKTIMLAFMICLHTIPSSMDKQFESFTCQLEQYKRLREWVRAIAMEIESDTGFIHANLLLKHQSHPVSEIQRGASSQITMMKELYSLLVLVLRNASSSTISL